MAVQFYGVFDADGVPLAFYNDEIHTPEQIPATAVPITRQQWGALISQPFFKRFVGGFVTDYSPPVYAGAKMWDDVAALKNEFTAAERKAIRNLVLTDDAAADFMDILGGKKTLVGNDPFIVNGFNYLKNKGILTAARVKTILGA